jgi:Tfp pilus assembly protein PilF
LPATFARPPGQCYCANDAKTAVESIDKLHGRRLVRAVQWTCHAGLILDLSGNKKEAGEALFDRALKLDATALRLVEAYGSWLSRNGKKDEAIKVFQGLRRPIAAPPR